MRHFGLAQTSPSRDQRTNFDPIQTLDAARAAPALQRKLSIVGVGLVASQLISSQRSFQTGA